jgi:hypothetical protein
MEAASLTFPARHDGFAAALRERRRHRRVRRLLSDAERFDRAARRLEQRFDPEAWQVSHLRRQAAELRDLAAVERTA